MSGSDEPTRTAGGESAASAQSPAPERAVPAPGDKLGRYVVRNVIGRGGMGVVFRASDPQLGRDVAIKVLVSASGERDTTARLLEEARAMAKLRHPRVLPVFDVGETIHGVFIAMPLVEGGTLKDWLRQTSRTWNEVVDVFVAAGRGLEAAHAAGIVHRDFKPTNVLLEQDGGVLVADFGIAARVAADEPGERNDTSSIVGTPAYMAPEQARGGPVDARADQFSFCVSFWEGLYGQRPDAGETATRDKRSVPKDEHALAAKDGSRVPVWLRSALLRGLSFKPERRWKSMGELLAEIERRKGTRPKIPRWRLLAIGAAAVPLVALALTLLRESKAGKRGAAPPTLVLEEPTKLTDLRGCTENPVFVSPSLVSFDFAEGKTVDLYTIDVTNRDIVRLTQGEQWNWRSRPGRTPGEIIYLGTNRRDVSESYIATLDLSTRKETSRFAAVAGGVSTVGDSIYYSDINGLTLRQRIGTEEKIVRNYPPSTIATFSIDPVSMRVAYVSARGGPLCHHPISSETPICSKAKVRPHAPVFSNDGTAIYAGSEERVYRFDVNTNEESTVLAAEAGGGVAVSPDGKTLVYSSCRPRSQIVRISPATKDSPSSETVLVEDTRARSPALGPAGQIAWVRSVAGTKLLVYRGSDGHEYEVTSPALGDVRDPSVDPRGTRLTFAVAGEAPGVYMADVSGGLPVITRLTSNVGDREPVWFSESGIAFERRSKDGISTTFVIDVPSGNVKQIEGPSHVTLTSNLSTGELLIVSDTGAGRGLSWLDPASGKRRPAVSGGPGAVSSAAVSRNGRWLLVEGGAAGSKWRARLPDGELTLVHEEQGSRTAIESAITDDGDVVAAPQVWEGELFVARVRAGSL